jgi:predicted transcriptional regulator
MSSATFSVRVDSAVKKRLEKLAKSTGRSRSFLAAEAIAEFVDVNEWQIAGIRAAMQSLDRGDSIPHEEVTEWVQSWGSRKPRSAPKTRKT